MKKRFIACIIACAMLLMGTGYAYWTDTITLKANVDTGDLQVKFTDAQYLGQADDFFGYGKVTDCLSKSYGSGTSSASIANDGVDEIAINLNDVYPGNSQWFVVTADNFGTLAAKLGKIKTRFEGMSTTLQNMLGVNIYAEVYGKKAYLCWTSVGWSWVLSYPDRSENNTFAIDHERFVRLSDSNLQNITNTCQRFDPNSFLKLDCKKDGKTVDSEFKVYIGIGMDPDAIGAYTSGSSWNNDTVTRPADADSESKFGVVKFDFVWDQYNAQ